MEQLDSHSCLVTWRGQKFIVDINPSATLKELGDQLQKLTNVKADTLRLLVPKSSKLLYPFSDEHSCLSLEATSIFTAKSVIMMGVPEDEVDEVLQNAKVDLRIAGFDEEEKRLRQKNLGRHYNARKLSQGTYVFCDFQTLSIPGMELNPPASKALELLHMLASDPGIVAIMNKHRWRVGLLSEMAPIGFVGVSPKCILGVNKNQGEEISLRLRTDDLKGFRKYQSIKKTLLHELAHMMYSEHDTNFYSLDSQLNKEAATLDWTKSRVHTLSGVTTYSPDYEVEFDASSNNIVSSQKLGGHASILPNARASSVEAAYQRLANASSTTNLRPFENDSETSMELEHYVEEVMGCEESSAIESKEVEKKMTITEPEFDDSAGVESHLRLEDIVRPAFDQIDDSLTLEIPSFLNSTPSEPDRNDSPAQVIIGSSRNQTIEPDPDDQELQIIQDPVTMICGRLQNAIQSLSNEVNPSEAVMILQTLIKIIRNVIEHPDEVKFKKLRKTNPMIQRNVVSNKAAMDILQLIGFCEDVVTDEFGKTDNFMVLKRDDPGLLWLAKSSLETYIAE